VSVIHEDYSGFIPANIYPDSLFPLAKPRNVNLPLSSLCKAYWQAKAYDINVAVSWETKDGGGASLNVGTMTGSGTFNLVAGVPQARTAFQPGGDSQPSASSDHPPIAWTIAGTTSQSGSDYLGGLAWFEQFISGGRIAAMTKSSMGAFLTRGDIGMFSNPQTPFLNPFVVFQVDATSYLTGITTTITVDGVSSAPIPIYADIRDGGASIIASGSIDFDFNSFWP